MNRAWLLWMGLVILLCVAACAPPETHLPYEAWRLGFLAPQNMDVWTEDATVEDVRGRVFHDYQSGTVSMGYNPDTASWGSSIGWGAGRYVTDAALPKRIYVRWQSLVEPQTYSVTLDISEQARQQMLLQAPSVMNAPGMAHDLEYYKAVAIGLAPGGIVRVWVTGPGLQAIPMMCVKAQIEPKGPDQGQYGGRYVTMNGKNKLFLENHPIPYGTWGC